MLEMNKIYCGDCLEMMHDIQPQSIDLVVCDLPYGTTRCKWDTEVDLQRLWEHYKRIVKPNAAIVLFGQTPFDKVLGVSNLQWLKYEIIWEKTHPTGHFNAKKMPLKAHENILVFYKKPPIYNPQKTTGHIRKTAFKRRSLDNNVYGENTADTRYDSTDRYPRSVILCPSDKQRQSLHPTQKPLSLVEWLIRTYSNPGDMVLDNCVGSGTTAEACIRLGRNFIGIEKEQFFVDVANNRIKGVEPERLQHAG